MCIRDSIVSSKDLGLSIRGAKEIKATLNKINDLEVLGPVDSPLLKIKNNFRSRLLIRHDKKSFIQRKISQILNNLKISSKIKIKIDVDPVNFS